MSRWSNATGSSAELRRVGSKLALAAGVLLLGAGLAGAASAGVEGRQARQSTRIEHGVESGSLTPRETARVKHQQVHIERTENRFLRNDGQLGPRERARLNRMQNRASRDIFRKKHNLRAR